MRTFKKIIFALSALAFASFLTACGNTTTIDITALMPDGQPANGVVLDVRLSMLGATEEFKTEYASLEAEDKAFARCQTTTDAKGKAQCEILENANGENATTYEVRAELYSNDGAEIKNLQSSFNLQESWDITIRLKEIN